MAQPVYALNLRYRTDPKLADLHPHRRDYIWHLFDKIEDLRPVLK